MKTKKKLPQKLPQHLAPLTPEEDRLLQKTTEVWTDFCKLQSLHVSESSEFCTALHQLQYLIMVRPVRRYYRLQFLQ